MDAYQPPPPYMRPPPGPPPPADPYQYYQHPARPPGPPPTQPGGPAWYSNQFHHPHSPSPPPPPPSQWGQPSQHFPQGDPHSSSAYPPFPMHAHQPPFNAGANSNGHFPPPSGPPLPPNSQITPPYHQPQANQEWGNPNWEHNQGQAASNSEDWAVKAREWASSAKAATEGQYPQPPPKPPMGQGDQVYQQYPNHGYQDVHQQAISGVGHQHFPVPPTLQPDSYPNYSTGNECFSGGSSAGMFHQESIPTSSAIHQQEVPSSYSSVAGIDESNNAVQRDVQISMPDGGESIRAEQQRQYAYGDQTAAPPNSLSDQPSQFTTRESSGYVSLHNGWPPPATMGVVYPPVPSSVSSVPQHDTSMSMPPVLGHTMPPFGRFPPPNLQPSVQAIGSPYPFGTKPPLHPAAVFMDDSYAASPVPERPKKAPVPNWLKEEILKNKSAIGRPSQGNFEERESMDDAVLYKSHHKAGPPEEKSLNSSKSVDQEEEEEDEDEVDAARTAAINLEIKRILTEVLLKVTDELFDEIATKVINEDESIPKVSKASTKVLVSIGDASKKVSSSSPADVLGLASYASDDDDADTNAPSTVDANGSNEVESVTMVSVNDAYQQPNTDKLPEQNGMANVRLDPEVKVGEISPKKPGLDEFSQMLGSRRNNGEAGSDKISDVNTSSALDDDTSRNRTNSDKDALLDEPRRKNSAMKSDCNLRQDSNKGHEKDITDEASKDRNRTDGTKTGKEKGDSQYDSKDRINRKDVKSVEKVKSFESNKKSTNINSKKDSRDGEKPNRTNSKEDRGRKREREKEEERSRQKQAGDSRKDQRKSSRKSDGSSDDSKRKSGSRRSNVSPSPVRSRRRRSSPTSDETSDDSRRKSSTKRRNRSPSPGRSRRRHVSRSPHSKHSLRKHSPYSSLNKSRSKRSRSRSPRRRHRA